jgi:hypothetical protein
VLVRQRVGPHLGQRAALLRAEGSRLLLQALALVEDHRVQVGSHVGDVGEERREQLVRVHLAVGERGERPGLGVTEPSAQRQQPAQIEGGSALEHQRLRVDLADLGEVAVEAVAVALLVPAKEEDPRDDQGHQERAQALEALDRLRGERRIGAPQVRDGAFMKGHLGALEELVRDGPQVRVAEKALRLQRLEQRADGLRRRVAVGDHDHAGGDGGQVLPRHRRIPAVGVRGDHPRLDRDVAHPDGLAERQRHEAVVALLHQEARDRRGQRRHREHGVGQLVHRELLELGVGVADLGEVLLGRHARETEDGERERAGPAAGRRELDRLLPQILDVVDLAVGRHQEVKRLEHQVPPPRARRRPAEDPPG